MRSSTDLLLPSPSQTLFRPSTTSAIPPCYLVNCGRMAASVKRAPSPRISFCRLSSELIALVFEQVCIPLHVPIPRLIVSPKLRDIDLDSLRSLRLVSRRLNDIATPIIYHTLTLNERLVTPDAEVRYPNAFYHIAVHTNHVIVLSNLNSEGITRVVTRVRRLSSVRYARTFS